MSIRLFFATIVMAIAALNSAHASSFVVPDEITAPISPSIVVLGTPPGAAVARAPQIGERDRRRAASAAPSIERFGDKPSTPPEFVIVSPSVIAMIEAPQPVTFENVASIGDNEKKRRAPNSLPMVIRGGIVGDAFSRSAPAVGQSQAPRPEQQVSSPRTDGGGGSPATNERDGPDERPAPRSALPPPAAPTGRME